MNIRVGLGFDIHRLELERPLLLGGVRVPYPKGLVGHSDGDALFHAVTDALLGAAGIGNIGDQFPDTDPRYKDVDSSILLGEAARIVRGHGFEIGNIDANIRADEPRLSVYFRQMESNAAAAMGVDSAQVNVKAKTMEGLGSIGRGEAIAADAVALVYTP